MKLPVGRGGGGYFLSSPCDGRLNRERRLLERGTYIEPFKSQGPKKE